MVTKPKDTAKVVLIVTQEWNAPFFLQLLFFFVFFIIWVGLTLASFGDVAVGFFSLLAAWESSRQLMLLSTCNSEGWSLHSTKTLFFFFFFHDATSPVTAVAAVGGLFTCLWELVSLRCSVSRPSPPAWFWFHRFL